jgi:hypothetical protein
LQGQAASVLRTDSPNVADSANSLSTGGLGPSEMFFCAIQLQTRLLVRVL